MCGIFGYFCLNENKPSKINLIHATNTLKHRGPDNFNYYENENKSYIFLGHQRLSIIDLNDAANQPMLSSDKRYVLIYNGEIYNHIKLRNFLINNYNTSFKTNSDTETLLNLIINIGIDRALEKIDGMFAFCLYDKLNNTVIISRDRIGEKPLYFYTHRKFFAFSSDLKSFDKLPGFKKKLNYEAIYNYFYLNYIPTPQSIFLNIFKLPQSTFLTINLNKYEYNNYNAFEEIKNNHYLKINKYWNDINTNQNKSSFSNILQKTELLLTKSIDEKLISDVPICTFLSGGVDSSIIATLLSQINKNIDTFTVKFDKSEYDESSFANEISSCLGLKNHKLSITKYEINDCIPLLSKIYTEPFSDSSQIPTFLITKKIKEHATVALGGDGGDELFGGYNRYLYYNKYKKLLNATPIFLRKILKELDSSKITSPIIQTILNILIKNDTGNNINRNKKILEKLLLIEDGQTFYESMINQNLPKDFFKNIKNTNKSRIENMFDLDKKNYEQQMMNNDINYYLPDDILCKVDRASMYNSLEVRSPFLSRDLIEFSYTIPLEFKINKGVSKIILKKILEKYLPKKLIYRPKKGFAVPVRDLLKHELKDWSNDLLSKKIIQKYNILNYEDVKKIHNDHINNNQNNEHILWSIIQLNQWLMHEKI